VRPSDTGDAGYVRLDGFAGLETALSFGINDDVGRDRGAADHGTTIIDPNGSSMMPRRTIPRQPSTRR
jgi:hypothetical protein